MIGEYTAARLSAARLQSAERRRVTLMLALAVVGSLAAAGFILRFEIVSLPLLLVCVLLTSIACQPRWGLYFAFGMVVAFEAGSQDSLMLPGQLFIGGLQSTVGLQGAIASPLELLLLLTLSMWLLQGVARGQLEFRRGSLFWPVMLFTLALAFGLVRGLLSGGDANVALWESRFLFYMIVCYVLAANTIRTTAHVSTLLGIFLIGTTFFAIEGAYRRVALIDTGLIVGDLAYSHDSVIYLGCLILLVIAQFAFGAPAWQRVLGLIALPIAAYTLLASERRAGYIATAVALLALALVLAVVQRKAFFFLMVPLLVAGAVYLPLFWNASGLVGQPARAVRSLTAPDPRDAASNEYRELEKFNVRATILTNPLLGIGFGQPFHFVVPLPDLSWWPFWRYEPHHNILWIWMKTGALGFALFWLLMSTALARASLAARSVQLPMCRHVAVLTMTGTIAALVFSYVDLGFVNARVVVFLGTLFGALSVLQQIPSRNLSR